MRIRALFFATYREVAGAEELEVQLPGGASVADLVAALRTGIAGFESLPPHPAVAVNLTYASPDTPLRDGDEVAFIPPVGGG